MRMRRYVAIAVVALLPLPALAATSQRMQLRAGISVLWNGPHIDQASGDETFEYELKILEHGERLRIGFDHPQVGDVFQVTLDAPGDERPASFTVGPGIYSEERLFQNPALGTWNIRVTAQNVTDSAFRMRAKLEAHAPKLRARNGKLLPNLQILPPHDASFLTPVTNGSGDVDPMGVPGGTGCHAEEHEQDGAVHCMRFGYGVRNTGSGPMDLSYKGSDPVERDLFQRILLEDGGSVTRSAGKAVFHESHGHWHHADAVGLRIYRVTDTESGEMEPAGDKRTKGFAHRNELLRDWDRFYPTFSIFGFGLRPGWADIYEWDRPGNYVDFGLNGDGNYVVRMWADPVDGILEMNERDNLGYTYMKVEGTTVELLEAGRGSDPWDRCKIVVGFGGYPDPRQPRRPSRCPPDTA